MEPAYKIAVTLSSLAAVCLLSSCATATVEKADAHFTGPVIATEKMSVGPVVQVAGDRIRTHEAETIRNSLCDAIGKKRNYISLSSDSGPNLVYLPNSTAENGVSSSTRSNARSKGVRYLLITELTENQIGYDTERCRDEEYEDIVDDCGKVIGKRLVHIHYQTRSETSRKLSARFKMLDLETGKTVWVSRSAHSNTASNSADSCLCYPPAPPHPSPPGADGVGIAMAKAAVRKLPRMM